MEQYQRVSSMVLASMLCQLEMCSKATLKMILDTALESANSRMVPSIRVSGEMATHRVRVSCSVPQMSLLKVDLRVGNSQMARSRSCSTMVNSTQAISRTTTETELEPCITRMETFMRVNGIRTRDASTASSQWLMVLPSMLSLEKTRIKMCFTRSPMMTKRETHSNRLLLMTLLLQKQLAKSRVTVRMALR